MQKLNNKVALVTGASQGIGASIAKHLAAAGARIVVNYASNKIAADQVVHAIKDAGGVAIAVQADVSKIEQVDYLFAETLSAFGKLDILVNNAANYSFQPLADINEENFRKHFDVNVFGSLLTIQKAVAAFGENGGSIINLSTSATRNPMPNITVYCATKAAIESITISLAKELGSRKIRVNALAPGMVNTEGTRDAGLMGSDMQKMVEAQTPLGRIAEPDDIGKVAVFLASEDSAWVSGTTLFVSGGER